MKKNIAKYLFQLTGSNKALNYYIRLEVADGNSPTIKMG